MGLFDNVRRHARDNVRDQAKDMRDGIDTTNRQNLAADLLIRLGRLVYAELTGRKSPGTQAQRDQILEELHRLEDGGTEILPES